MNPSLGAINARNLSVHK